MLQILETSYFNYKKNSPINVFVTQNMIASLTELKMNSAKTGNDGNYTILGGDGVDVIDSGDGENFVTPGRHELVNKSETDLGTLQDHIKSHKDIFEDNDWI